jgi:hypothetical protein
MPRVALLAVLLAATACDRGRVDTLERRVEALEKKDTERGPTSAPDGDTAKTLATLQLELTKAKEGQAAADAKVAALSAQLAELQEQYNLLQERLAKTDASGTTTTTTSAGKVGIKACDEYIEKYTKCISDKVPEAARGSMNDAMDATIKAWREAATGPAASGLETACKAALEAAAAATKSMGCEW